MKKGVLLHSDISAVISRLGHTDQIVISDAGLPIPSSTQRIDLALTQGTPDLLSVFDVVVQEVQVEAVILAAEIIEHNPQIHEQIIKRIADLEIQQGNAIAIKYVSHSILKEKTEKSKAIIRTGECSPYANILLCSGVTF
ncbi:D-ribose pyranase [Xenorhabdus khoisanae]|uniref:D-ribose pyranase n=1 Tax=Xenorhabdus khoisanae TaxID=880157 RepID=A0A0J5FNM8_9GAMM|nr:D-ribose pyranase [Xenorhabdus khoisanae]KMJ43911.1 D-ribose pyranase [Xenorhabdus khoisanae]MDC9613425.1 D-ribose pyranase [Xenorhabdus khoisanae]